MIRRNRVLGGGLALVLWAAPGLTAQSEAARQREIQTHIQQAQQALQSGNSGAAEREFQAILALDPDNVDVRANLGVMQFFQDNWAGAAKQFREVLDAQPDLAKAKALLGMCERRLGNTKEALRLLEESWPRLQKDQVHLLAGTDLLEIYYQAQQFGKVGAVLWQLQNAHPNNKDVLYKAYRFYTDLAFHARDALASIAPDSARMLQLLAQHSINEGHIDQAIRRYRRALEIDPKTEGLRVELGQAIITASKEDSALAEAEKLFRDALDENPDNPDAESQLGRISLRRSDMEAALLHFQRALKLAPNHLSATIGAGETLTRTKQFDKALDHLLAANRLDPSNLQVHLLLAMTYRGLERPADAKRELEKARELEAKESHMLRLYAGANQPDKQSTETRRPPNRK